jgi:tetratricopeptide (TPR) repeat protein
VIDAADTFQRAIKAGVTSSVIMLRYADLLVVLDSYYGVVLPEFVLIDPKAQRGELLLREAIEACEKVLDDDPDHIDALYSQLVRLVDVNPEDARFWPRFERLVSLDSGGDLVRNVVDSLYSFEDVSPALDILRRAVADKPDRCDLHLNLAAAYLVPRGSLRAA